MRNHPLKRLIAVLLIPCFLGDPALFAAFPSIKTQPTPSISQFSSEALANRIFGVLRHPNTLLPRIKEIGQAILSRRPAKVSKPKISIEDDLEVPVVPVPAPPARELPPPKVVLLQGGLGDLSERFLRRGFSGIAEEENIQFIVVDVKDLDREWEAITERMRTIGMNWRPDTPYLTADYVEQHLQEGGILQIDGAEVSVAAAIIVTPPSTHFGLADLYLKKGVKVAVEKPLVMPDTAEISQMAYLMDSYPDMIFPIDFTLNSEAFLYALRYRELNTGKSLFDKIGPIQKMYGKLTEAGTISAGRTWWGHRQTSGGGSLLDVGVHLLTPMGVILKRNGDKNLANLEVNRVVLGRHPGAPEPTEYGTPVETFGWMGARARDIPIVIECGAGIGRADYFGFTIVGEQGTIEIRTGSGDEDPSINATWTENGKKRHYRRQFPNSDVGYVGMANDFAAFLKGQTEITPSGISLKERQQNTLGAVFVIEKAYSMAPRDESAHAFQMAEYEIGDHPTMPAVVPGAPPTIFQSIWHRHPYGVLITGLIIFALGADVVCALLSAGHAFAGRLGYHTVAAVAMSLSAGGIYTLLEKGARQTRPLLGFVLGYGFFGNLVFAYKSFFVFLWSDIFHHRVFYDLFSSGADVGAIAISLLLAVAIFTWILGQSPAREKYNVGTSRVVALLILAGGGVMVVSLILNGLPPVTRWTMPFVLTGHVFLWIIGLPKLLNKSTRLPTDPLGSFVVRVIKRSV